MTDGKTLQDLKREIDQNENVNRKEISKRGNDQIEIEEMEEFLKSENNIEALGNALKNNIDGNLLMEFKSAISKVCETIIKTKRKDITENQIDILYFYICNFEPENNAEIIPDISEPEINDEATNDNNKNNNNTGPETARKAYRMEKKETKPLKKYDKIYYKSRIKLAKLRYKNRDKMENRLQKQQNKEWEKFQKELEAIENIRIYVEKKTKFLDDISKQYENDIKKVQEIITKGELTKDDKKHLLYFQDYYNCFASNIFNADNIYKSNEDLKKRWVETSGEEGYIKDKGSSLDIRLSTFKDIYDKNINLNGYFREKVLAAYEEEIEELIGDDNDELINKSTHYDFFRGRLYSQERGNGNEISDYINLAKEIDKKLNPTEFNALNNFINGESSDIAKVYKRYLDFGKNHPEFTINLKEKLSNEIKNITIKKLNKDVRPTAKTLNKNEIMIFQLRANIEYGEELEINGTLSPLQSEGTISKGETTSLYIYRQRLTARESKTYKNILKIPNINDALDILDSNEKQHIVLRNFLNFLFNLERNETIFGKTESGIGYENRIGGQTLSILLDNMITSEFYKGKTVDNEIQRWEEIKKQAELMINIGYGDEKASTDGNGDSLTFSGLKNQCEEMIKKLKGLKLNGNEDLGKYYSKTTEGLKEDIIKQDNNNRLQDYIEGLNKQLSTLVITQMNNLPKLNLLTKDAFTRDYNNNPLKYLPKSNEQSSQIGGTAPKERVEFGGAMDIATNEMGIDATYERYCAEETIKHKENYKISFKNVAINFINIWRTPKNRQYISESLSSQIFLEIYFLWKNDNGGITKIFGNDIEKECNRYAASLFNFSEKENKERELIVDTYYQCVDANNNIENGRSERGEQHYDTVEMDSQYKTANDTPNQSLRKPYTVGGFETTTTVIHNDDYNGNLYHEPHKTPVQRTVQYVSGQSITTNYHGYGTENYDPNTTIVGPDPNGRYAILPDNLKQKSNEGKIKLAVINGKACVYEFEPGQPIKMYEFDKNTKKLSTRPKTITVEQYTNALKIESDRFKVRETDHGQEYKKIQDELSSIFAQNDEVNKLFEERNAGDLDLRETSTLKKGVIHLCNITENFYNNRAKISNLIKSLEKLNTNSSNYENPHERQIKEQIANLNEILSFATERQVQKTQEFRDIVMGLSPNAHRYEQSRQDRLLIVGSFLAAIAATIIAISTLGLGTPLAAGGRTAFGAAIAVGAISTATAMTVNEIGSWLLDGSSTGSILVDGVNYELTYNGTTPLKQAINGDISRKECIMKYGRQYVTGTVLQGCLMRGGARFSKIITTHFFAKATPGSFADKVCKFTSKILCREDMGDPYTQNIVKSIGKQTASKPGFFKQFFDESLEEAGEEIFENAAKSQGKILGYVAIFINCLKPKAGMQLQTAGVSIPEIQTIEGENKALVQSTYDSSNPNNIITLKRYYEGIKGYDVHEDEETGILTVTAHGVEIENMEGVTKKDIEMVFMPSKAPMTIRNIPTPLRILGSIFVDEETGETSYGSTRYLRSLGKYLEGTGMGSVQVNKDGTATLTIGKEKIEIKQDKTYLNGKQHLYNINPEQVLSNSKEMDKLLYQIELDVNGEKTLETLQKMINDLFKAVTKSEEGLNLTKEQLLAVIEAHKQDGELGNLGKDEIMKKHKILSETGIDEDTIRFLFEAGFCGKTSTTIGPDLTPDGHINHNEQIEHMKISDFEDLLALTGKIKLENLNANDLRLLIFKACNIGLDNQKIMDLGESIINRIKKDTTIKKDLENELITYIEYQCYTTFIKNITIEEKITDPNKIKALETQLNNYISKVKENFKENPIILEEVTIEIHKKKFELYKNSGNTEEAQKMINKIQQQNKKLLANDTNNFRYKRGIFEANLLQIQLGGKSGKEALDGLTSHAQELREETGTIGGRTDTETLISKIEAGIILGKTTAELQPYLDFLALTESGAGINILGAVIQTINTTFNSDGAKGALEEYAKNVTDAGKKWKDSHLLEAGEKAKKISDTYNEMKSNLNDDPNWVHHSEIQSRLEKFVKGGTVSSISNFGNDFSHFTVLLNPQATRSSPVMSIEIGKVDYEAAYNELKTAFQKEGIDIEGDIGDFNTFIEKFNKVVDNRIRTTFGTENLQELNSPEHRALFDYIAAKFMESRRGDQNASLTNLSQLFNIRGLQDCRVHAFTKQLFFDTWKTNKLNNLEKSKAGKSEAEIAEIDKQIKIIENTKMTFLDAQFSGNVDMNTIYVARTEEGHMVRGSQNNVIEEHTFNLIEIPILDENGNIQYEEIEENVLDNDGDILDEDGKKRKDTKGKIKKQKRLKVKTKVCFADSFYHGNDGKVYNLSYTGKDISSTIYGKNGEDVYMTTTVTGADGKPIDIKIKPLTWSIKGRGDNIVGSSIKSRGPSTTEAAELNAQYEEGLKKAEILKKNREEIQRNLGKILDKLKSGQKVEPTDIEKALTSTDGHKVTKRQANQLKRAFELYEKLPTDQKTKAGENLRKMIASTVTQNAIEFEGEMGGATEFSQSEGVFFDAMQVFNDVYITEIKEATKHLDPKNPDSIKRLQKAIEEYQKIFDADMKDFFERSQQTMLDDGKRGPEYHRNNFEKVAKRFQNDMELYIQAYKSLENIGKTDEAYEIREYILQQETELLRFCDKKFEHMIDFKKLKKEMKGPKGREIYNQLKEIQGKEDIDLEIEFKKSGLDRNYIKEMAEMDKSAPLNKENLNEAISKIEKSGLKEYYDTINLVFNPGILAIHMENAVYSGDGIYTLDTGLKKVYNQLKEIQDAIKKDNSLNIESEFKKRGLDRTKIKEMAEMDEKTPLNKENLNKTINKILHTDWRTFSVETKEEYTARKDREANIEKNINDNTQPGEIEEICYGIVNNAKEKIPNGNEAEQIKTTISELITLCEANGIRGKAMYDLCKTSTEALIFQTIESKTRSMGDHGINHISGNIAKLNTYIKAGVKAGKIPASEAGKYELMGALTHIFHDIGYAATISKGSNSFDGSNIHPFTSKAFFDSNVKSILENAKINTELISKAIESHDGIRLNWGTPESTFLSMVNLSDNMALGVDKISEIRTNPHLLKHIATLYALDAAGIDIKRTHEIMIEEINNDKNLNENQKETLKSAIEEISKFSMGNVDFWSISPLTTMEFSGDVPTLSMFKGDNLMLVAEVCGIDSGKLKTAIDNNDRNAVIELLKGPDGKGTKFCSQIIKPLGDYCDIYTIYDAKGKEYPKVDGEYDWNEIKADLLLGKTITLKDGDSEVLNYRYEGSTDKSISAEQNSVYGNIDMKKILREGVEARNNLQSDDTIETLGKLKKLTETIKDKIKENKDISKEIDELKEILEDIKTNGLSSTNDYFNNKASEFMNKYDITGAAFKGKLEENYKKLSETMGELGKDTDILAGYLLK